jgi:pyruvate formate lyase activating enzyme
VNARLHRSLRVGGLVPFTSVDYPGRLSAVVFCQGCPWRCRYCHNTHLQPFGPGLMEWADIEAFLADRRGFLDAVVFSGGEPTAQSGLARAVATVKAMGFLVGLHTAGLNPPRFRRVLPWVDWVGFDVKAPFDARYDAITGRAGSGRAALASLRHLLASGVACQLRTTIHPRLLSEADREELQEQLKALGAEPTLWQTFRATGCRDESLTTAG